MIRSCTTGNRDAIICHLDCCRLLVTGRPGAAPPVPGLRSAPAWAILLLDDGHSCPLAVVVASIGKSGGAFARSWIRVFARQLAVLKNFLNRGAVGRQKSSRDEA